MQVFSTYGEEFGKSKGLNYIPGKTVKFEDKSDKLILPFVGYHKVEFKKLKKYFFLKEFNNKKFYFVHSYHVIPEKNQVYFLLLNNKVLHIVHLLLMIDI